MAAAKKKHTEKFRRGQKMSLSLLSKTSETALNSTNKRCKNPQSVEKTKQLAKKRYRAALMLEYLMRRI